MRNLASILLGAAVLAGCASQPDKISAAYVSPLKYATYDCDQLAMEMDHVSNRTTDLYFNLKSDADNDAAQMGIGLVLFWPALFFLEGGDGPEAAEYANLKGEYEALRTTAVEKKCAMEDMPPSPETIIAQKQEEMREAKRAEPSNAPEGGR